jgi:predicted GIY-YIG superfamily endonuclease
MAWYVYILQSAMDGDYYKGITEDVEKRVEKHKKKRLKNQVK